MERIVYDGYMTFALATTTNRRVFPTDLIGTERAQGSLRCFVRLVDPRNSVNPRVTLVPAWGINRGGFAAFTRCYFAEIVRHPDQYTTYLFEHEIELARWLANPEALQRSKQRYKPHKFYCTYQW